jgi:hypothetical protein
MKTVLPANYVGGAVIVFVSFSSCGRQQDVDRLIIW